MNDERDLPADGGASSEPHPKLLRRRPLFRREERHEFRYRLAIAVAWLLSGIAWLTPEPLRMLLADVGGSLAMRAFPSYRENVVANLVQVTGLPAEDPRIVTATRSAFRTSARNFADLLTVPHRSRASLVRQATILKGDWSLIDLARAEGNGIVMVTGHLGCFDHAGQVLSAMGYPLSVVTGRTTARFLFDAVTWLRGANGMRMFEPTPSGVRSVIKALRRGECAVFVADRDFFQNGKPVTYFGRETTLPPGPIRIARDSGALVLPMFALRRGRDVGFIFNEPFRVAKTADLEADMQVGMQKLAGYFENAIREHIDQWVMFQRVWPLEPADPFRVFPVGSPLESGLVERIDAALPPPRPKRPPRQP